MRVLLVFLAALLAMAYAPPPPASPPTTKPPTGRPPTTTTRNPPTSTNKTPLSAPPPAAPAGGDDALGRCKNCVYVVERIKQGYHYLLPNICEEILAKTQNNEEYATCHQLLAGLSRWGADVRHWLHNGCYRVEPYGSMSLVQPCPSHVICSKITDLESKSFCAEVMTDFTGTAPE